MNIIARDNAVVNLYFPNNAETPVIEKTNEKNAKFKQKLTKMKKESLKVSKKMKHFNLARGKRMEMCADTIHYYSCPHCQRVKISNMERCRDRMCPLCNWLLAKQRLNDMIKTFNNIDISKYKFYFLTLTIRNVNPEDIRQALESMAKAWDKMMKRKDAKDYLRGWARSVEMTYNPITHTLHPHYHVILMYDADCKYVLDGRWFKPVWKETMNISYDPIIDFTPIRSIKGQEDLDNAEQERIYKAVLETFKYSIKSNDLIDMPQREFNLLVEGINQKRLVSFGGVIKKIRSIIDLEEDKGEINEELKENIKCDCGADMLLTSACWSLAAAGYKNTFAMILSESEGKT